VRNSRLAHKGAAREQGAESREQDVLQVRPIDRRSSNGTHAIIFGAERRMSLRAPRLSLDDLRPAAERVAAELRCRLVVLFGSAARGSAAEDVDLGVLGEGALDTVDVTNRFIRALRVQAVDVTDLRRADPLLLMLAAQDGVPLYERDPGEFTRFASLAARRYADTHKFRVSERDEVRDFVTRSATRR
jgi:predicted nucleotidyltransferase